MTDRYCTLYVTIANKKEAVELSRKLIGEKLVACANISGAMLSLYQWEGRMCEDYERAIFLKTRKDMADQVIARIRELHSYDTPCIIRWDITGGNENYLAWIGEQTG